MKVQRRVFAALLVLAGVWGSAGATEFTERELKLGYGKWAVPATLTLPTVHSPVPAVVLVHGSGPGLRDLPVGGSTIFRDLAHGLARQGVAVIRYDKRTTAHTEAFDQLKRRATVDEEFVADATSATAYLMSIPQVDAGRVYVVGHSQGAALAPRIANNVTARGVVMIAGSMRTPGDIILQQARLALERAGSDAKARKEAEEVIAAALKIQSGLEPPHTVLQGAPAWYWRSVSQARPIEQIESLTQRAGRVLIVHGGRDSLVTQDDLAAWRAALPASAQVAYLVFPTLNHLMQAGEGLMTPAEYACSRPVDAELLADLARWLSQE